MLTIRGEQMAVLQQARQRDFENRLCSHLELELTRLGTPMANTRVRECISRGVLEAPSYGLQSERHVADFVEATLIYLGGFPKGALPKSALAILYSYGLNSNVKLQRYQQWAAEHTAKVAHVIQ